MGREGQFSPDHSQIEKGRGVNKSVITRCKKQNPPRARPSTARRYRRRMYTPPVPNPQRDRVLVPATSVLGYHHHHLLLLLRLPRHMSQLRRDPMPRS